VVARFLVTREVKCYLCGAVSGRLLTVASASVAVKPRFQISSACPDGPRFSGGRLVCCFCGGSLFLDRAEAELHETQRVYPRERRGRPPKSAREQTEDSA
jgi:hypothetical protein